MSRSIAAFGKILSTIVRSLFFSGMIFIIFFSIVTGGFPPDFRKITKAFGNAKELSKMSQQQQRMTPFPLDGSESLSDDERDVAELEAFNKKRAFLGEGLFGTDSSHDSEETITPVRMPSSISQEDLKAQLLDMQQEIFRLQQRVSELEEQAKQKR